MTDILHAFRRDAQRLADQQPQLRLRLLERT